MLLGLLCLGLKVLHPSRFVFVGRYAQLLENAEISARAGVLIFSQHPALYSIAVLSVTGMICVVIASLTLQLLLYDVLIDSRKKRGFSPLELRDFLRATRGLDVFLPSAFNSAVIRGLP